MVYLCAYFSPVSLRRVVVYLLLSLLPIKRRCDSIIKRVGHNHVACVVLCGQKLRSRPLPVPPCPATLPRTHLPDVSKVPITARSQITKNENVNHITNALRFYNCMKYFCFCWPFHLCLSINTCYSLFVPNFVKQGNLSIYIPYQRIFT